MQALRTSTKRCRKQWWQQFSTMQSQDKMLQCKSGKTNETLRETMVSAVSGHAISNKAVAMQPWKYHETLRETVVPAVLSHAVSRKAVATQALRKSRKHCGKQRFQQFSSMQSQEKLLQCKFGKLVKHCGKQCFQQFSAMQTPENLLQCKPCGNPRSTPGNSGFSTFQQCKLKKRCCNASLEN